MATSNQLPSWLIEYIQEARDLFSIGGAEWSIYTKLTDKPAGNSGNSGSATKDWRYLNATLEFSTELEEGGQARETAMSRSGGNGVRPRSACNLASTAQSSFVGLVKFTP